MPKITIKELQEKIERLELRVEQLENEKASQKTEYENQFAQQKAAHEERQSVLNEQIKELERQNEEKQKQLNIRELKKLAQAYREQEVEYIEDVQKWFKYSIRSLVLLGISIVISFILAHDQIWYERIEYYFVNFVIVTFLVFALKQYSRFNKLRTDYANRKTLAQSYHNILTSEEDTEIRSYFLNEAASVLAAKNETVEESHTIPEKLLESITEIAKNLSKK